MKGTSQIPNSLAHQTDTTMSDYLVRIEEAPLFAMVHADSHEQAAERYAHTRHEHGENDIPLEVVSLPDSVSLRYSVSTTVNGFAAFLQDSESD